jgi:hypothetical protein
VVPKADDFKALCFEEASPPFVALPIGNVLSAINFNDQFPFQTYEINDVRWERMLPAKFKIAELTISKSLPQERLSIGLRFSQGFPSIAHKGFSNSLSVNGGEG